MNEASFDQILISNPLIEINTWALFLLCLIALISARMIAWRHRNEYQVKSIIRDYAYYGIIHLIVGTIFFKAMIVLTIGSYLMGIVALLFRSNKYFYQ